MTIILVVDVSSVFSVKAKSFFAAPDHYLFVYLFIYVSLSLNSILRAFLAWETCVYIAKADRQILSLVKLGHAFP